MKPGNRQHGIVEMVPIHTKQFALIDERKDFSHLILSAHCCRRDFLFSRIKQTFV